LIFSSLPCLFLQEKMIRIKTSKEEIEIFRIDFGRDLRGEIRPFFVHAYDSNGIYCCLRFEDIEGDEREMKELIKKFSSERKYL